MSKIELDDMILEHPKFIRAARLAGSDAIFLWLGLRAYCSRMLTDGFIPLDMVEEVRGPRDSVARAAALVALVEAKLVDDADGGIRLHDYLEWAQSRAQVLAWRKANAERKARSRARVRGDVTEESHRDMPNVTPGLTRESRGSHGGVPEPSPSPSPSPYPSDLSDDRYSPLYPPLFLDSQLQSRVSAGQTGPAIASTPGVPSGELSGNGEPPEGTPKPKTRQKGSQAAKEPRPPKQPKHIETDPPDEFIPTEATLAAGTKVGRDWRDDWARCRDWALSKGVRRADWQATLREWMRRAADESRGGRRAERTRQVQPNGGGYQWPMWTGDK